MRGVIAASSKKGCVQGAASAGGVSISSFPNGDTRGRATNDVNATPGAKFRAGHQKHHSVVGHLDSRPAPHYKQLVRRAESKLLPCSFPMSRGPPAYTVQARVGHLEVLRTAPRKIDQNSYPELNSRLFLGNSRADCAMAAPFPFPACFFVYRGVTSESP